VPEGVSEALPATLGEYPRVDGSTAAIPLGRALLERLVGVEAAHLEELVVFNTTPVAYLNLADNLADLVLGYEPAEETKREVAAKGAEFDYFPIGSDGLVFLVNTANPIESLTQEQVRGIYTGDITNWKDVGGADAPIAAFQRPEDSGSQSLMRALVMGPTPMATPPMDQVSAGMSGLIEALASFDNAESALGYSVFFYASEMYSQPNVKIIAVDGVTPSAQTIASGAYPYVNDFYAVVRASEPADSPARAIALWLTGPEGQELVTGLGYAPAGG